MKAKRIISFLIVVLIIGGMVFVNLKGIPNTKVKNVKDSMRYGIDIKGGVSAILVPKLDSGKKASIKDLENVQSIMNKRLDKQQIYTQNVSIDETNRRINIEFPWKTGQQNTDPQKALDEIGKTARLTFREVNKSEKDPDEDKLRKKYAELLNKGKEDSGEKSSTSASPESTDTKVSPSVETSSTSAKTETISPENKSPEATESKSPAKETNSPASEESSATSTSPAASEQAKTSPVPSVSPEEQVPIQLFQEEMWANNKVVLDGNDVVGAKMIFAGEQQRDPQVQLTFSKEGQKKFAEATERLAKLNEGLAETAEPIGIIAIYLDDQLISYPRVSTKIDEKTAVIEGGFTPDSAENLAELIAGGALPFKMEQQSVNSISPILGQGAMDIAVYAGLVALMLVILFMLVFYRFPGLIAAIALIGMVAAQLLIITSLQISLTLPGIAGIILSVGMGVDANVIIFERIKEEMRAGKTLRAAIELGFKRAFSSIVDSNITTIITAVMLIAFGTGPIKGFGITLFIGILVSFFSAVLATRVMLLSISGFSAIKHPWLYGVRKVGVKNG